jgi:hypothetical protein
VIIDVVGGDVVTGLRTKTAKLDFDRAEIAASMIVRAEDEHVAADVWPGMSATQWSNVVNFGVAPAARKFNAGAAYLARVIVKGLQCASCRRVANDSIDFDRGSDRCWRFSQISRSGSCVEGVLVEECLN